MRRAPPCGQCCAGRGVCRDMETVQHTPAVKHDGPRRRFYLRVGAGNAPQGTPVNSRCWGLLAAGLGDRRRSRPPTRFHEVTIGGFRRVLLGNRELGHYHWGDGEPSMSSQDGLISRRALLAAGVALAPAGLIGCASSAPASPPVAQASSISPPTTGIRFQTSGATFRPAIELVEGSAATIEWLDDAGRRLATGTTPTIDFGSSAPRVVTMTTTYAEVVTVNLGFNHQDDVGRFRLDASYDKEAEAVTAVQGLGALVNLRRFLAAEAPLGGTLDVSGLAQLEFIECGNAQLEAIDLTGCNSLIRLVIEGNRLTRLDLNPVAKTLCDLRAALQKGGSLELAELSHPLSRLYHFCIRDQKVAGHPSGDQLPACEELWNWNTGQKGAAPKPNSVRSFMSRANQYTSADFSGLWTDAAAPVELDLEGNQLTTITIAGCRALQTLRLLWNSLPETSVDGVLAEAASWGTKGTTLLLNGNAPPSPKGLRDAEALRARGWEVLVSSP